MSAPLSSHDKSVLGVPSFLLSLPAEELIALASCCLMCHWLFPLPPPDTPSSPSIDRVEPYSSTARVEFDEPEATGGVPILKYKAEWRALGEGEWHSRLYDAKEGKMVKQYRQNVTFSICISKHPSFLWGKASVEDSIALQFQYLL